MAQLTEFSFNTRRMLRRVGRVGGSLSTTNNSFLAIIIIPMVLFVILIIFIVVMVIIRRRRVARLQMAAMLRAQELQDMQKSHYQASHVIMNDSGLDNSMAYPYSQQQQSFTNHFIPQPISYIPEDQGYAHTIQFNTMQPMQPMTMHPSYPQNPQEIATYENSYPIGYVH